MRALAAVFVGGGLGSMLRYATGLLATARWGSGFPVATISVNVVGSFAIGIVIELAAARVVWMTPLMRTFLVVGILGGFTTFSSFSADVVALVSNRSLAAALGYMAASIVLGLAGAYAGMALVRAYALHT